MDTIFATTKGGPSIRGYVTCQIFATEFGHVFVVPMKSKLGNDIMKAVKRYFKEVGVPDRIVCNGAREQVKGEALALCNSAGCQVVELEKGTLASNCAERYIQMLKNETKADLASSDTPFCLWCYCIERRGSIINSVACDNFLLQGQVPNTKMHGQPTDISALSEFAWYQWVKYRCEGAKFPYPHERLGRALGPAAHAGTAMSQWVLTETGNVLPLQTFRALTPAEINSPAEQDKMACFTAAINAKLGNSSNPPPPVDSSQGENPHDDPEIELPPYEDSEIPEADDVNDYDLYINAEVVLPQDGKHMKAAKVIGRSVTGEGLTVGDFNPNPIIQCQCHCRKFALTSRRRGQEVSVT